MANTIASTAFSVGTASRPLSSAPGTAEQRRPIDRFLVPVPAEAAPATPRAPTNFASATDASGHFELTTATSVGSVIECLRRTQSPLRITAGLERDGSRNVGGRVSRGRAAVAARVVAAHARDLLVRLDARVGSGPFSARVDMYDVPFLIRGQLQVSAEDLPVELGERGAKHHAIFVDFENIGNESVRGISWGMDGPARGVSVRYVIR